MIRRLCLIVAMLLISSIGRANDSQMFSDLTFPNLQGETVNINQYRGKVVLLNFWATWCPPCVKEMPSMQRLREKLADQPFEIVAISAGESAEQVEAFLLELDTELTFPILIDEKGVSFMALGIRGLPMSFVLDKEGKSVQTIMGGREWDEEKQLEMIREVLAQ